MVDASRQRRETICDIVCRHGRERPGEVAFRFEGRDTSFAAFAQHCRQVAAALRAAGCRKGARVAFLGRNSDQYFELLLGAAFAGVVVAPLNWRLSPAELGAILADAQAELLFAGPDYHAMALELAASHPAIRGVIEMAEGADARRHFAAWRDAATPDDHADHEGSIARSDVFLQLYTSGTTGRPKGVMLSHGAVLGALDAGREGGERWRNWTPDAVALVAMPVFHISGTGWALGCFYGGGRSVILPEFSIPGVGRAIATEGVTHAMMVPAALQMLMDDWETAGANLRALRLIAYGASPMPPALLARCRRLPGCDLVQYYGMTETTGSVVALPPEDHTHPIGNRLASTGRVMSGNALRIVDAAGVDMSCGAVGEVWVRTPGAMTGYWQLPQATAETITADGWLRTGDAGYLDADGYLFLCDRIKDMIISGGENIYPIEVETAILSHPAVSEVAVIGVPDAHWGEAVKAVVVLKQGQRLLAEELIAHVRRRIAGYKTPRSVDFVAILPRNSAGKLLKRELRAPYWAGQGRNVA